MLLSVSRPRKSGPQVIVDRNGVGTALYEKSGFERKGANRRYALRDGGPVDTYSMARVSGWCLLLQRGVDLYLGAAAQGVGDGT